MGSLVSNNVSCKVHVLPCHWKGIPRPTWETNCLYRFAHGLECESVKILFQVTSKWVMRLTAAGRSFLTGDERDENVEWPNKQYVVKA